MSKIFGCLSKCQSQTSKLFQTPNVSPLKNKPKPTVGFCSTKNQHPIARVKTSPSGIGIGACQTCQQVLHGSFQPVTLGEIATVQSNELKSRKHTYSKFERTKRTKRNEQNEQQTCWFSQFSPKPLSSFMFNFPKLKQTV